MRLMNYLNEQEKPGMLELVETDVEEARKFAEKVCENNNRDLDEEIPNFNYNYVKAQEIASGGWTKRQDMPVINIEDVKVLQRRLERGKLDVRKPFASHEYSRGDPFPRGLSDKQAEEWLRSGLDDGNPKDDRIKTRMNMVEIGSLSPIQKQIYFDKSMTAIAEHGVDGTRNFLQNISILVVSNDDYIIDGHHRMLSGLLLGPKTKAQCIVVDLSIEKLLPLSKSYSDAIGNKPNL